MTEVSPSPSSVPSADISGRFPPTTHPMSTSPDSGSSTAPTTGTAGRARALPWPRAGPGLGRVWQHGIRQGVDRRNKAIIGAIQRVGVRALFATGWSERAEIDSLRAVTLASSALSWVTNPSGVSRFVGSVPPPLPQRHITAVRLADRRKCPIGRPDLPRQSRSNRTRYES